MPSEKRLHPSSILFTFGARARSLALPGLLVLVGAGSAGGDWQVWAMFLLIPYALVSVTRYVSFRYRYEANEMVVRTGLLFRNERHVPYARIQNLDAVQNVFHRLLGVVEVRVETGAGQEPEATMSVLPVADFEEMRRRVFEGTERAELPTDADAASPVAGRTLLRLSPRELMLYGLIENRGGVVIAAALGAIWEVRLLDRFGVRLFGKQPVSGVIATLYGVLFRRSGLPWSRIAFGVAAVVGILLFSRLISMGWAVLRLHGFRLTRVGDDLRTAFGLLTRVAANVPRRRIQTLTIREGPLHRYFRRVGVRVDTAGADPGGSVATRREWLAPVIRPSALPALLHEVLPEVDYAAVAWHGAHPRAFRRALKSSVLLVAAISLALVAPLKWWILGLFPVLLVWACVNARLYVRHLGWAVTNDAVLFRSGWAWRQTSIARFSKIQAVAIHESPFDRRAAMARLRVDTAGAGDASHRVDIPYLPRETARDLCDLLANRAERTAFRW